MNLNNITCGLDFGTSNSVITLTDKESGKEIFTYNDKSILYFPRTNEFVYYVGKEAQNKYVEEQMQGRLLKSVKTLLNQERFLFTWICGKKVTPEQLCMFIIRHLKEKAEAFLGTEINSVVLGRPAIFSEDPKREQLAVKRLTQAARDAGFKQVVLQMEPIAAAFHYEATIADEENVLVADFGGGTSDFTIMKLSAEKRLNKDRHNDILAYDGAYIGGDTLDFEILWDKITPHLGRGVTYKSYNKELLLPISIYHDLKNWERAFMLKESKMRRSLNNYYIDSGNNPLINNLRVLIDKNYTYSLFRCIEQSKMNLSKEDITSILFEKEDLKIEDAMSLSEFGQIIEKETKEVEQRIVALMDRVNMTADDIHTVFITGGTSYAIPIRNVLNKIFDSSKICYGDAFTSVAHGLSLSTMY